MSDRIMLFIPMYNCEAQIARVLDVIDSSVASWFAEIVVVDNQSTDESLAVAEAALRKIPTVSVTLLRNEHNYSLGGSHKVAFNHALERGYDYVVVLHGDDQGDIRELIPRLERREHTVYDSYLGARFARGSKLVGYSAFRTWGNIVFNAMISLVARRWITDMGSGLNIYKTSNLENRFYLPFPNDLTFNVFMLYYGIWKRSSFAFFSLTWREDDQVSNAKVFHQASIILGLTWRYLVSAPRLFSGESNDYSRMSYQSKVVYEHEASSV